MTRDYTPPTDFRAENGATFRYRPSESGDLQVSILDSDGSLLAGFSLTVDHVAWMYRDSQAAAREPAPELKPCEHCGATIGHWDGCPTVPPGLKARGMVTPKSG
ncbi:MAG TPA: hypothetical protein VF916_00655 [Ktedonobacterales bacterium]